jgi:hypothetical protein
MKERHWNSRLIMVAGAVFISAGELRALLLPAAPVTEHMGNEMPKVPV